jgi:Fe-S-cluster containining protein
VRAPVLNGEESGEALAEGVNGLGARGRPEGDGGRAVIRETDCGGGGPEAGAEDGRHAGCHDHGNGRVHAGGDGPWREADAASPGLFLLDPGTGATLARPGNHRAVEADGVADQGPLRLDQAFGTPVADGEETAELVHHFVGIQSDGEGVVANEGAGEDPGRPAGEVVALEPVPEFGPDFRDRSDGFQRNAASLPLAPQPRSEGLPVRHDEYPVREQETGPASVFRFWREVTAGPGGATRSFAIDVTESTAVAAYCLTIHSSYECAHSGECCTAGWAIPAELPLIAALSRHELGPAWTAERAFEMASGPEGPVSILRTDGQACVFYDPDERRCSVHRQAGPAALPTACRNFPRITLSDRRGIFITLSHFCPTAARLLLEDRDIAIVEAPASLSLDGAVEGLDATGVLPPLLRRGMLTDAEGYAAWEAEAIEVWNDRRHSAQDALAIVSAATDVVGDWRPGTETLAACARRAFDRARAAWDGPPAPHPRFEHAIKSFLAAHQFASWHAYQDDGLHAVVRAVETAFATLGEELAPRLRSGRPEHGRRARAFITAVRAADLRLRHSRTDVRPRPLSSLRRH